MSTIGNRIQSLQNYMKKENIDALYISGTDVHLCEYVAPRFRTREWITGFTGSAGTVILTKEETHLWVDSRYYIQGALQVENTPIVLEKLGMDGVRDPFEWLAQQSVVIKVLGIDKNSISVASFRTIQEVTNKTGIEIVLLDDFFDSIWSMRPLSPYSPIIEMKESVAGVSRKKKIASIRSLLKAKGADSTIISTLDDIAWITNLRAGDLPHTPVFFSYMIITQDEAIVCTQTSRFSDSLLKEISKEITIVEYEEMSERISSLLSSSSTLYLSPEQTTMSVYSLVDGKMPIIEGPNISTALKAVKNEVEVEGMRRAHLLDGIALVKLLSHIAKGEETFNEVTLAKQLETYREEQDEYLSPSFSPIAGFGPHGAMEHYSATTMSNAILEGNSLLVLDTGGQYVSGTTDVTRTLCFGEPTDQMKKDYTLVLKGNLALSVIRFPKGTCGYQLDVLARQFLWQAGLLYGHGTGHGVGYRLNVHEGPHNISPKPIKVPLVPGMIISNEPGLYRKGEYGIRLENLITVFEEATTKFGPFYTFEVLTLCPFDISLIETSLMSEEEIVMLNAYHGWVFSELKDHLPPEAKEWLQKATLPLTK